MEPPHVGCYGLTGGHLDFDGLAEEVRLGVQDVDVEGGLHAGANFADAGAGGEEGGDFSGGEGDGVEAFMAREKYGAGDVEIIGDDGDLRLAEDFAGADDGIECAEAGVVECHRGLRHVQG